MLQLWQSNLSNTPPPHAVTNHLNLCMMAATVTGYVLIVLVIRQSVVTLLTIESTLHFLM